MRCKLFLTLAFSIVAFIGSTSPLSAQEAKGGDDVKKEIEKELDAARKSLLEKLSKITTDQETRIAKLEKTVKDREREIAELKKTVNDLAAAKPKAEEKPAAAPAKPPALLGVAHEEPGDDLRAKLNLKAHQGARVTVVQAESPAAKA